jgi:hypothetical protein
MGPFDPDVHGFQFAVTLRDHASMFTFVSPMRTKAEVPESLTLQKGLYRLQPPAVTSARGDRCYIGCPDRFYVGRAHRYIRTKA